MTETPIEDVRITHAFAATVETDEAKRRVSVSKSSLGTILMTIQTDWKSQAEPVVTEILLTPEGLELLAQAAYEAHFNMETYRVAP